jgi:THO complex subunit 1
VAARIAQGSDGKLYWRMVETVVSRDKNWVRWKIESCQSFERPALSAEVYREAKRSAEEATAPKKLRPTPARALDLGFLSPPDDPLEELKNLER